jgi:hypothetical protein
MSLRTCNQSAAHRPGQVRYWHALCEQISNEFLLTPRPPKLCKQTSPGGAGRADGSRAETVMSVVGCATRVSVPRDPGGAKVELVPKVQASLSRIFDPQIPANSRKGQPKIPENCRKMWPNLFPGIFGKLREFSAIFACFVAYYRPRHSDHIFDD